MWQNKTWPLGLKTQFQRITFSSPHNSMQQKTVDAIDTTEMITSAQGCTEYPSTATAMAKLTNSTPTPRHPKSATKILSPFGMIQRAGAKNAHGSAARAPNSVMRDVSSFVRRMSPCTKPVQTMPTGRNKSQRNQVGQVHPESFMTTIHLSLRAKAAQPAW